MTQDPYFFTKCNYKYVEFVLVHYLDVILDISLLTLQEYVNADRNKDVGLNEIKRQNDFRFPFE